MCAIHRGIQNLQPSLFSVSKHPVAASMISSWMTNLFNQDGLLLNNYLCKDKDMGFIRVLSHWYYVSQGKPSHFYGEVTRCST